MTIITESSSVLPRVVILTAVPVEYKAVREFLAQLTTEEHPLGKMYERGRFECAEGGWDVLLAEIGQGNANAALETQKMQSVISSPRSPFSLALLEESRMFNLATLLSQKKSTHTSLARMRISFSPDQQATAVPIDWSNAQGRKQITGIG